MRLALALMLLGSPALAEGARQTYQCRATLSCDDRGACEPSASLVTFAFEPLSTGPDGSGDYRVLHDDVAAPATFSAPALEYLWSDGSGDPQRLMVVGQDDDGSARLVWHSLDLTGQRSTLLFLSCEVTL
jgi:hypothetical protein